MLTKEEARGAIKGYYVLYRKKANPPKEWENKTVNGEETTSFLVTPLDKFTLYEFAMQAFNSKGVSDLSTTLEETTAEDSKFFFALCIHVYSLISLKLKRILHFPIGFHMCKFYYF